MRHAAPWRAKPTPHWLPGTAAHRTADAVRAHTPTVYIPHVSGFTFSRDFGTWNTAEQYALCALKLAPAPAPHAGERALLYEPVLITVPAMPSFSMLVHHAGFETGLHADVRDHSLEVRSRFIMFAGSILINLWVIYVAIRSTCSCALILDTHVSRGV